MDDYDLIKKLIVNMKRDKNRDPTNTIDEYIDYTTSEIEKIRGYIGELEGKPNWENTVKNLKIRLAKLIEEEREDEYFLLN